MERIDLADAGEVVVLDAQMLLAVFQVCADSGADVARVARRFVVLGARGNVMGKLLIPGHRLLTDIAKEVGPENKTKNIQIGEPNRS